MSHEVVSQQAAKTIRPSTVEEFINAMIDPEWKENRATILIGREHELQKAGKGMAPASSLASGQAEFFLLAYRDQQNQLDVDRWVYEVRIKVSNTQMTVCMGYAFNAQQARQFAANAMKKLLLSISLGLKTNEPVEDKKAE